MTSETGRRQVQVYGNASDDGFAALVAVVGGLFVAGGLGLTVFGGVALPVGLFALGVVALFMLKAVSRSTLQREVPSPSITAEAARVTFTVPAETEAVALFETGAVDGRGRAAWTLPAGHDAYLPAHVDAPRPAVETNTPIA